MTIPTPAALALHDWLTLTPDERAQALADIRSHASSHGSPSPFGEGRRPRALHVAASVLTLTPVVRIGLAIAVAEALDAFNADGSSHAKLRSLNEALAAWRAHDRK